jgi:hypothetical protein
LLEFIYLRETIESSAVPRNFPEEHIFRSYPIGFVSIESLINHHALLSLGVEGRMDEPVFAALEVLEISFFLKHYNQAFHFPGGHTPTEQEVKTWYAPLAQKMLMEFSAKEERYFQHFKGGKYKFIHSASSS